MKHKNKYNLVIQKDLCQIKNDNKIPRRIAVKIKIKYLFQVVKNSNNFTKTWLEIF